MSRPDPKDGLAPVTPWIAALAKRCLSFYLGQYDNEIQVEDREGRLAFSFGVITPKAAIVTAVRFMIDMNTDNECC
jgi:hypothetical protein